MRRVTSTLLHGLKDRVRGVRYSIRAEAAVPGSAMPRFINEIDFGPLSTLRSMIGTPALRVADGLFTQVEDLTTGVIDRMTGSAALQFPRPLWEYGEAAHTTASFPETIYAQTTRMLTNYGARNMFVSEYALDSAWSALKSRHGDLIGPLHGRGARSAADVSVLIEACAAAACAYAQARPIQRVEFGPDADARPRHLVLAPNVYIGMVIGLASAIVTVDPSLASDPDGVLDNADAAVDARFGRFKQAADGKTGAKGLAKQFEAILPYLR